MDSNAVATASDGSLRSQQLDALLAMLNLNGQASATDTANAPAPWLWKVLVYDALGQAVISPLLRVSDLRENGVTVHMLLHSDRQPIPDAPAVYFVEPTAANIARIAQDIAGGLYDSFHLNFSSALPRPLLEQLASATIQAGGTYGRIAQIYDQYLNFLTLEDRLFTLNTVNTYAALNDPQATDSAVEALVESIAASLFSTIVTAGVMPVIRCARGNAAEMVARKLEGRLRDQLVNSARTGGGILADSNSIAAPRPVLVLLDRNLDLAVMLSHTWSYQCLVHDVMDMKSNRVAFISKEKGSQREVKKSYDIDVKDFFWRKNAAVPFPQMAQDVDLELNQYTKEVDAIAKNCGVSSLEDLTKSDPTTSAQHLKSAIDLLPKLTERKRTIDMHMNIASALLEIIKDRSLDSFIMAEENVGKQTKAQIMDVLKSAKGSPEDKLRLFAVYFLTLEAEVSKEDFAEYKRVLEDAKADVTGLEFLRSLRAMRRMHMSAMVPQITTASPSRDLLGKFSSFGNKFAETGFGSTLDTLISGVKNILPVSTDLPVTRVVESLMDGSTASEDDYLFLDPKAVRQQKSTAGASRTRAATFQHAMVFMVGGGNYTEYQNLQELAQRMGPGHSVTYGATELLNAKQFLQQLSTLGQQRQ